MIVNAKIEYNQVGGFPEGTAIESIQVQLKGAVPTNKFKASLPPGSTHVAFSDVPPGTYEIAVAALDTNGNILGDVAKAEVIVPAPGATVSLMLPSSVSVQIS